MNIIKKLAILTGAISYGIGVTASAAEVNDNLHMKVIIGESCIIENVVSPAPQSHFMGDSGLFNIRFGVEVKCVDGVKYQLGLDAGNHYNGATRRLAKTPPTPPTPEFIEYKLLTSGMTVVEWGDQGLPPDTYPQPPISAMGNSSVQFHGGVFAYQLNGSESAGVYEDTVLVRLVF
jgi:spore coat protein U-like protein